MKAILIVAISLTLLSACEKQAWRNYQMPDYDGEFIFTEVTQNAKWTKRWDMSTAIFNNQMWIFGGYNPGLHGEDSYLEDVWSSSDGEKWNLINNNAPWHGRRGHVTVTFNDGNGDAIYLIGGFSVDESTGYRQYCNDVWKSSDGKNWNQIKLQTTPFFNSETDWYPRFDHTVVVANHNHINYMYLIGGASLIVGKPADSAMKYFNDVWRSKDGINWEKLKNNDFGLRGNHAAVVNQVSGEIFIQGGYHGNYFDTDSALNEPIKNFRNVWKSSDGINWESDSINRGFSTDYMWRANHKLVIYHDYIYGFPGKDPSSVFFAESTRRAIWKRLNENQYIHDSHNPSFYARYGYGLEVWNDKIWVFGGYTAKSGQSNDVWTLEIQ